MIKMHEAPPKSAPGQHWLTLVCCFLLAGLLASTVQAGISKEYRQKATFLYNFPKFVDWPPDRFVTSASPIVIGVSQANEFCDELEKLVRGRKVNGRDIIIRVVSSHEEARSAHLIFVSVADSPQFKEMAHTLHDSHVLTVGESELFAAAGGIITFGLKGDKLHFAINRKTAGQASLKISAQLLKLANTVYE